MAAVMAAVMSAVVAAVVDHLVAAETEERMRRAIPEMTPGQTMPEQMMKPILTMAKEAGVRGYAAMERYLPCSIAKCGLCMVGDRLTCTEGPVMEGNWLLDQPDFGDAHSH